MESLFNFEKWHGTGNDFILAFHSCVEEFTKDIPVLTEQLCDRHFGIGSDGLITIDDAHAGKFKMRMWNPDGSEAEMCGNGIRCVAGFLICNHKASMCDEIVINTLKGPVTLSFPKPPDWLDENTFWVKVDMGKPLDEVPASSPFQTVRIDELSINQQLVPVNMGNPHAVIFVDDLNAIDVAGIGSAIENCREIFPNRVNVEFVQVIKHDHVRMRVWERGAGLTLSCGSGTAAVQVACHLTGKADDSLRVDVPGGTLFTEYARDGRIFLTGPAKRVFKGIWTP